jgi:cytochrome c-type biogenesis protein CcmE
MSWLRSKVFLAFAGVIVIGLSTGLVVYASSQPPAVSQSIAIQSSAPSTRQPTSTSAPLATPTPNLAPTGTPTVVAGQAVDLHGVVGTIGNNAFQLQNRSGTTTIIVTSQTRFTGSVPSFGALRQGNNVEIIGHLRSDGSCVADEVNAQTDN